MISVMVTPELVLHQDNLAAGNQPVIHVNVDGLTDLPVEFEHCAGGQFQQVRDMHAGMPEHGGNPDRHIEHSLQIGRRLRCRSLTVISRLRCGASSSSSGMLVPLPSNVRRSYVRFLFRRSLSDCVVGFGFTACAQICT